MRKINLYKALDKLEAMAKDKAEADIPFKFVFLRNGEKAPIGAERDRNTCYIEVLPPCNVRA